MASHIKVRCDKDSTHAYTVNKALAIRLSGPRNVELVERGKLQAAPIKSKDCGECEGNRVLKKDFNVP